MKFRKTLITSAVSLSLISGVALAHPKKTDAEKLAGETQNKTVKIIKLDGNTPFKGKIKIEDFDFDFSDLGADMLEGLEELDKFKGITGLDVQTLSGDDGETTIIIKSGKGGMLGKMFSNMEFDFGEHKKHGKHAKHEKHKKHLKHLKVEKHADAKEHAGHSRMVIKKMLKNSHEEDMDKKVHILMKKDGTHKNTLPHTLTLDEDMTVLIDKDETVHVLKDGKKYKTNRSKNRTVNVDKTISTKNGKRTTKIVIEIEEAE